MFADGFSLIINTAWGLLNTIIIPSGSFGSHGNITFLNILLLGLGGITLARFIRFCMGGNFSQFTDRHYRESRKEIFEEVNKK